MAGGLADDLATTLLLATDKRVLAAPAMNVRMWHHAATMRNVARLRGDGVTILEPDEGAMACGEYGAGRLPDPEAIAAAVDRALDDGPVVRPPSPGPLAGVHALVTAGPTHEPIDPVRYIANRSSGRQGFAVAQALAARGARVTLVAGPVALATPSGCERIDVETAQQMAAAVDAALPADVAVMVAAVADWRVEAAPAKVKKGDSPPALILAENPDILAGLARSDRRPRLLIGFAAETERVVEHAVAKRVRKGADWIVANDVSADVFGSDGNAVHLVTGEGVETWERLPKSAVADRLADRITLALSR
jgi:phosphopantothenoylcysteine decarboxylase/phosphopantothenate--cysteine ligase